MYGSVQVTLGRKTDEIADQLGVITGDQRTVIIASTPDAFPLYYAQVTRKVRNQPEPQRLYWLSSSSAGTHFSRLGRTSCA